MKKKLVLPKFKNEAEEMKFWDKFNLTEYYEPGDFVRVRFPNLKPSSTPISIRLPTYMISELKVKANRLDIPYQTLIKQAIAKEINISAAESRASYKTSRTYDSLKKQKRG